jgi:hypothetical protein
VRSQSFVGLLLFAAVGLGCLTPASASAQFPDPDKVRFQWNGRLVSGFGTTLGALQREFFFDTQGQFDAVWGKPGNRRFRIGPMLNFRTATFLTWEGAAGATMIIPTWPGYPIVLSGFGGYAFRKDRYGGDGFFGGAMLEWGYRPYNHHGKFQIQFSPFVQTRIHHGGGFEMSAGISLDFSLAAVPFIFLANWATRRGDPQEPPIEGEDGYEAEQQRQAEEREAQQRSTAPATTTPAATTPSATAPAETTPAATPNTAAPANGAAPAPQ